VAGSGGELGQALVDAKPLKAVSFTGSCQIGQWLHAEASKRRLRIQLEMGGRIRPSCWPNADFGPAVENVRQRFVLLDGPEVYRNQPRDCGRRDLRQIRRRAGRATKKLKVGDGMQPGIDIARRSTSAARHSARLHRDRQEGSRSAPRRRQSANGDGHAKGYFVEPTIFADVTENMRIAQEEIFRTGAGRDARQGFRRRQCASPNNIPFGLSASIQTTKPFTCVRFCVQHGSGSAHGEPASAGVEYQLPFGGSKESSFGPKEQGPAAMEFYSDYKTVYLKY